MNRESVPDIHISQALEQLDGGGGEWARDVVKGSYCCDCKMHRNCEAANNYDECEEFTRLVREHLEDRRM